MPVFGILLTLAYGAQCLRIPYFRIIKAAGHYKETQNGAFISMFLNIIVSVVLVFKFQLVGVAIGSLVALFYHTVYFAWYLRKNIINRPICYFLKHIVVDIVVGILGFVATSWITMNSVTYVGWIGYAIIVAVIVGIIALTLNFLVFRNDFVYLLKKVMKKI